MPRERRERRLPRAHGRLRPGHRGGVEARHRRRRSRCAADTERRVAPRWLDENQLTCVKRPEQGKLRDVAASLFFYRDALGVQLLRKTDVPSGRDFGRNFDHGFGPASVPRVGCRVYRGVPKYVARINSMYEDG